MASLSEIMESGGKKRWLEGDLVKVFFTNIHAMAKMVKNFTLYHFFCFKYQGSSTETGQTQICNKGSSFCSCTQQIHRMLWVWKKFIWVKIWVGQHVREGYQTGKSRQVHKAPKTSYSCTATWLQLFESGCWARCRIYSVQLSSTPSQPMSLQTVLFNNVGLQTVPWLYYNKS